MPSSLLLLSPIFSIESIIIVFVSSFNETVFVNDGCNFSLRKWHSVFNDEFAFNIISSSKSSMVVAVEILSNSLLE